MFVSVCLSLRYSPQLLRHTDTHLPFILRLRTFDHEHSQFRIINSFNNVKIRHNHDNLTLTIAVCSV